MQDLRHLSQIRFDLLSSINQFDPVKPVKSIYINSVPKSGTMLIKTVLMHVFGKYAREPIIFYDSIFDIDISEHPIAFGHLVYQYPEIQEVSRFDLRIQIIRHPCDLLIALVRTAYDPRHHRPDCVKVRASVELNDYMSMLVDGYEMEQVTIGPFSDYIRQFLGSWLDSDALFIDYTQMIANMDNITRIILNVSESDIPPDLKSRVDIGSGPQLSSTYVPKSAAAHQVELSEMAHRLISARCPDVLDIYQAALGRCTLAGNPDTMAT